MISKLNAKETLWFETNLDGWRHAFALQVLPTHTLLADGQHLVEFLLFFVNSLSALSANLYTLNYYGLNTLQS